METSSDPIVSIGLRHVIEDSIAALNAPRFHDSDRAEFALRSVSSFLQKALRGAEMTSSISHSVRAGDMSALEIYSKMLDFFDKPSQPQLQSILQDVSDNLSVVAAGKPLKPDQIDLCVRFLENFLKNIRRAKSYRKQSEPEMIITRRH